MLQELKNKFGNVVKNAFFEMEDNLNFLRVEVDLSKLDEVAKLAKQISLFLDEIDYEDKEYYLDVYSTGTEKNIDKHKLKEFIGKNIFVSLKKEVKNKINFKGEIIEVFTDAFIIKWNAKGQFRKQEIEISNIEEINISSKIEKRKK